MDEIQNESNKETASLSGSASQPQEHEVKSRVDAVWQQMNTGVSAKTLNSIVNKSNSTAKQNWHSDKASNNWMSILGLGTKTTEANGASLDKKSSATAQNGTSDDSKKLVATALVAARYATATSLLSRGKIEVIMVHQMVQGLMSKLCHRF